MKNLLLAMWIALVLGFAHIMGTRIGVNWALGLYKEKPKTPTQEIFNVTDEKAWGLWGIEACFIPDSSGKPGEWKYAEIEKENCHPDTLWITVLR